MRRIIAGVVGALLLAGCTSKHYSFEPDSTREGGDRMDVKCGVVQWVEDNGFRKQWENVGHFCIEEAG